ncbi:sirohydrochlorin chelatase [Primorskyibacter marinus]|uniref:sirohydrochlorin chelatase n=1 Tax=Primorskyibacter marinus TaxID=1977320 RepID=UPI000E30769E|nr:cobalamin biosynthesis protein CbiX [Primorskyibacter marinus]
MPSSASSGPTALIVAHGSPSDPDGQERALADLAARAAAHLPGWQVSSATLACKGRLEEECARLGTPMIYPFFMAEGYFTRNVLAQKSADLGLTMLPPFGVDPALEDVAETVLRDRLRALGWEVAETDLLIAAHGSAVSKTSRNSAQRFAKEMMARCGFLSVATGYVEEPPFLADAARGLGAQSICLAHFALRSGHVEVDLPEAFEVARFRGPVLPPMIEWPETPGLIANSLLAAHASLPAGRPS